MGNKGSKHLVLALDTSRKVTTMAVARGAEVLGSIDVSGEEKRSERLWSEIESLLSSYELSIGDVDVLAVCTGPGGFTGLRVGIAAVKGLAVALQRPVVGVTSLEAAAFGVGPSRNICAMVNAYKNEVYSQLFCISADDDSRGLPVPLNEPQLSSFEEALDCLSDRQELVFTGDGVEVVETIERHARVLEYVKWTIKRSNQCVAEDIARIGSMYADRGELQSAESLKACYVRPSEAEVKLSLGLLGSKIKRSMKAE